ncbi:hypothetical protein IFJ82_08990 [Novacetimonas hansenii]|uniref:Lipoprotein n=2 Tax=Novacetimonas hansenii TaxID=436 RepID=A0AAW5ET31_NOVHA|nr:hypothetical protein [Novacetimonas hansenii]MCJ8354976.1 hypothetical protein [Novacetimonas hansenii]QOF94109.1 hypothetical protein IFJ82_08990 [Novacetimonas hansenii]WEQ59564.1 hypothetical protein LV563_03185 [Novacetimonas hansenii]CUW47138.1 hypothetical protein ATCC53582_01244 [Novacetimonas hansenii]
MMRPFNIFVIMALGLSIAGCHAAHRDRHPVYWHDGYHRGGYGSQYGAPGRR